MKRLKYIIGIVLSLLIFSCTDLEEEIVSDISPDGYFTDLETVEAAVVGTYGLITDEDYWGRKYTLTILLQSDMTDIGERTTPARRQNINDFEVGTDNGMITAIWPRAYKIISAANYAIEGAESLSESSDIDADDLSALIAESKLTRAFIYFNMVRMFGDIPYLDYAVSDPSSVSDISATSTETIYENIITDLKYAYENLDMTPADDSRSRPSKGTAYTILADVYLTLGEYQNAYTYAKWVIDNAGALGYKLEADYQDLFDANLQDNLNETIWHFDFSGSSSWTSECDNDDLIGALTGIRGSGNEEKSVTSGWSVAVPALAVYNSWDDRDYRKKVAIADSAYTDGVLTPYTEYQSVQRPHIKKYFWLPGTTDSEGRGTDHNYAAYRYGEVLLTAAEALNETSGATDEAIGYVNLIRERARNWNGTTTDFPVDVETGITQDDFRDLVLEERRLELSFEFKRWYDIQRRELGDEVFKGNDSYEPHSNFNSERDYLLPIPQDEIDRNPNLEQNPEY